MNLGSPIRLFTANGKIEEIYAYDEFEQEISCNQGSTTQVANKRQSIMQPFTYTRYQGDRMANTYYAQARKYKPAVGHFNSEDVIKGDVQFPISINN